MEDLLICFYIMYTSATIPTTPAKCYTTTQKYVCKYIRVGSAHPVSAAAPTASVAFSLDVYNNIHVPPFQKLDRAFAHILNICGVRGDNMDDTQDLLLSGSVAVVMVMIVVMRVTVRA